MIKNLDNSKGLNNDINIQLVKLIWNCDMNIILRILKNSLKLGCVPDSLKISIITPIPKVKNSNNIVDFRPINTLPVIEQILEEVVKKQLEKFVDVNNILADEQSGFRKMFSCETAVQSSIIDWQNSLDKGLYVGVVFIDFARAFETISRNRLIKTLESLGLSGTVLQWFKSYLENRKQKVKFMNKMSDEVEIINGVPQGSKLGPILFNIYINDIIKKINDVGITCKLFADDTKLYFASKELEEIEIMLNRSLNILAIWLKENQLIINLKKTVFMILHYCKKNNVRNKCTIRINDTKIEEVRRAKYLGVIIDDNLTFRDNAIESINKVARKLNIIYRLDNSISCYAKNVVYKAVIAPHFDYCSSIMLSYTQELLDRMQKVQNKGMRLVLGVNKYTSIKSMIETLGWMDIRQRMIYNCCILIHKLIVNETPQYLFKNIVKLNDKHGHDTRGGIMIDITSTRTHSAEKSIAYKGFNYYNKLPNSLKVENRMSHFKRLLKIYIKEEYCR